MPRKKLVRRRVIDLLKYSPMMPDFEFARIRVGLVVYGGVTWLMNIIAWHFIFGNRVSSWYSGSTIEDDPCFPQTWYHMLLDVGTWNTMILGVKWGCCAVLTLRPYQERVPVLKLRRYVEIVEQFILPFVMTTSVYHWSVRLRWIRMNGFQIPTIGYVVMANTFAFFPLVALGEVWLGKIPFEYPNWWFLFIVVSVHVIVSALYSIGSGCWLIPSLNPRVNIPWLSFPGYYFMYVLGYTCMFVYYQVRDHGATLGQIALPPFKYNLKNTAGKHINPMDAVNKKLKEIESPRSERTSGASQRESVSSEDTEPTPRRTLLGAFAARRAAKKFMNKRVTPEQVPDLNSESNVVKIPTIAKLEVVSEHITKEDAVELDDEIDDTGSVIPARPSTAQPHSSRSLNRDSVTHLSSISSTASSPRVDDLLFKTSTPASSSRRKVKNLQLDSIEQAGLSKPELLPAADLKQQSTGRQTPKSGRQVLKPLPKVHREKFQKEPMVPTLKLPQLLLPGELQGQVASEGSESSEDAY